MPRFYYHVRMQGDDFPDAIGREHPDLSAAHRHALTLAKTLMWYCEADQSAKGVERWIVHVANQWGGRVLSVIVPYRRERPTSEVAMAIGQSFDCKTTSYRPKVEI